MMTRGVFRTHPQTSQDPEGDISVALQLFAANAGHGADDADTDEFPENLVTCTWARAGPLLCLRPGKSQGLALGAGWP
eukprot:4203719-Heterocapsa_arctica.AAC.1